MAEVARVANRTMASIQAPPPNRLSGKIAGEALSQLDACYIKASDGLVYKSNGTTLNNEAAKVRGYADGDTPIGEAVTLLHGMLVQYGSGLTPGASYYASAAVPGGLSTTATTGGTGEVAFAYDTKRIFIKQSNY